MTGVIHRVLLLGALGLVAVSGLLVAGAASGSGAGGQTFTVQAADFNWLSTGLTLAAGETVTLTLAGDGTCSSGGTSDCPIGHSAGYLCSKNPVIGPQPPGPAGDAIPYGAVAGRLGTSGTPFLVKDGTTVTGPGELFLIFNDCNAPDGYGDNAGSMTITVNGTTAATTPLSTAPGTKTTGTSATVTTIPPTTTTSTTGFCDAETLRAMATDLIGAAAAATSAAQAAAAAAKRDVAYAAFETQQAATAKSDATDWKQQAEAALAAATADANSDNTSGEDHELEVAEQDKNKLVNDERIEIADNKKAATYTTDVTALKMKASLDRDEASQDNQQAQLDLSKAKTCGQG